MAQVPRVGRARTGTPAPPCRQRAGRRPRRSGPDDPLLGLERDDGGLLAIASQDGTIRIYDPASETELSVFRGHYGVVHSMKWCVSRDQLLLATGGEDRALHIWNPGSSHGMSSALGEDTWVNAVAWGELNNQKVLATAGRYDGVIRVWELSSARSVTAFKAHESAIHTLAWGELAGRPVLASGGDDATVRIWDPLQKTEISRFTGHHDAINSVAWHEVNGRAVIASASDDGTVFVWDALEGNKQVLLELDGWGECVLDWSTQHQSMILVIGGVIGFVEAWNPLTASKGKRFRADGAVRAISCFQFDNRPLLAIATNAIYEEDSEAVIQVWDLDSGEEQRRFSVAGEIVSGLVSGYVNQRCVLACSTENGMVQLYDMISDDYSIFRCDAAVLDIDMAEDGLLAIGHTNGIDAIMLTEHWHTLGKPAVGPSTGTSINFLDI